MSTDFLNFEGLVTFFEKIKGGLLRSGEREKLAGIEEWANNYTLPTAGRNVKGGVMTTSTVTSSTGYTACPIIGGVPYYRESGAVEWSHAVIDETNEIDFGVGSVLFMTATRGDLSLNIHFPSDGEFRLVIANEGPLCNITVENPGVAKMVVPQNISVDYGGSVVSLTFSYFAEDFLLVTQDYPLRMN